MARKKSILTENQEALASAVAAGVPPQVAAANMNIDQSTAYVALAAPKMGERIVQKRIAIAHFSGLSPMDVIEGLRVAIDQAKILADPMSQIAGWREIGKMCGFYEPEKKIIEVSDKSKRKFADIQRMSDEELMKVLDEEGDVLDVAFTEQPSG